MKFNINLKTILLITAVLCLSACSSINRNIYISRSDSLIDQNININVIGANKKEIDDLKKISYEKYWLDKNIRRKFTGKNLFFASNSKDTKRLSKDDAIWEEWEKSNSEILYILSNTHEISDNSENWVKKIPIKHYSFFNFWSDRNLKINIEKNKISIQNATT
jgi:hypothetical protein